MIAIEELRDNDDVDDLVLPTLRTAKQKPPDLDAADGIVAPPPARAWASNGMTCDAIPNATRVKKHIMQNAWRFESIDTEGLAVTSESVSL